MPFEYLEEAVTSDVTFHAWAASLDDLFAAAVDATTRVMVEDLATVRPVERRPVAVHADALDLLLLRLLDEIVFLKDTESLLLRADRVHVDLDRRPFSADAMLAGEPIDRVRHELLADVKAVTLYGLRIERLGAAWHAHVTLDV